MAVVVSDGHTCSRAAIVKWFEKNRTSPLTGERLPNLKLLTNHALRKAIEEACEKQPLAIEPGSLQIHKDQVLGEGSHGCVVAGTLSLGPRTTVRVAVKMLPGMTHAFGGAADAVARGPALRWRVPPLRYVRATGLTQ